MYDGNPASVSRSHSDERLNIFICVLERKKKHYLDTFHRETICNNIEKKLIGRTASPYCDHFTVTTSDRIGSSQRDFRTSWSSSVSCLLIIHPLLSTSVPAKQGVNSRWCYRLLDGQRRMLLLPDLTRVNRMKESFVLFGHAAVCQCQGGGAVQVGWQDLLPLFSAAPYDWSGV